MANWSDQNPELTGNRSGTMEGRETDAGLRSYMLKVYNYMAGGLAVTGIVAFFFAQTTFAKNMYTSADMGMTILRMAIMFGPLAFVWFGFSINRSAASLQSRFWIFAVLLGLSLSYIFMFYGGVSIAQAFFATAAAFASLSLWGYTTKRDLSGWGSFLFVGLIGVIFASIGNFFFFESSGFAYVMSILVVLISAGMMAYQTQATKSIYYQTAGDPEMREKMAIFGALNLYVSFVNMFTSLLHLFGNSE